MGLVFRKLHPHFVAEVSPIDLRRMFALIVCTRLQKMEKSAAVILVTWPNQVSTQRRRCTRSSRVH